MPPEHQEPLRALAREVKETALDLRGRADRSRAERELTSASERLGAALAER